MRVTLDISEVVGSTDRAREALITKTKAALLAGVRMAAYDERQTHAYVNRSGLLEKNTKGVVERSGIRETRAVLMMDRPYASFIMSRGLTNIQSVALDAERAIEDALNRIALP